MSKAQLVITAVVLEGRSKSEVARDYDVCRYWVQQLVKRYETEGAAAFAPHSRHLRPARAGAASVELVTTPRFCRCPCISRPGASVIEGAVVRRDGRQVLRFGGFKYPSVVDAEGCEAVPMGVRSREVYRI